MRTVLPFPGPPTPSFNGPPVIDPSLVAGTPMATSPTAPYESRPVSPAQAQTLDSLVSKPKKISHDQSATLLLTLHVQVSQLAAHAAAQGGAPGPGQGRGEGDVAIHNILSAVSRQPSSAGTEQPPWSVNPGPGNGRPPPPPEHTVRHPLSLRLLMSC